jgi:hypothetical protein
MGYVYLLTNPSMPGLVKVGCTDRSPNDRVSELSTATGVPTPFTLEFFIHVPDHLATEQELHSIMSADRVSDGREFFRVPLEKATALLRAKMLDLMISDLMAWDDDSLMKLVDTIFSKRPNVKSVF